MCVREKKRSERQDEVNSVEAPPIVHKEIRNTLNDVKVSVLKLQVLTSRT